jgi:hypothetical protein
MIIIIYNFKAIDVSLKIIKNYIKTI